MYITTKRLRGLRIAHRLSHGYSGKCSRLHGHNYNISISFSASNLNAQGFVVDFSAVKELFEPWLKENWDHGVIVSSDDNELIDFLEKTKQKYFIFPSGVNCTVEHMAKYLFDQFNIMLQDQPEYKEVKLTRIEISETDENYAAYTPDIR